ncbi:MAG: ABC transporter substrate-binding protein [Acidimicrobiia bacterium]|nr:ABC transporter substrate-binding protein [Acidimicrobiia bacterium]
MKIPSPPRPELLALAGLAVALVAVACAEGPKPTSTTADTTTFAPATTEPELCPDVFCIRYDIRPDATWSDGTPVTSDDFIHTYEAQSSSPGYSLITGFEATDDKTILFAFSEPYGPWQTLFGVVVPAHAEDPLSVSAGSFVLGPVGEEVILLRNPESPHSGDVESIRFVRLDSVRDGLERMRSSELDLWFPPAVDWVVDGLEGMDGVEFDVGPGPVWDHIDFNLDDPLLGQEWVRRVINLSFDPQTFVEEYLREIDPEAGLLLSAVWSRASAHYLPNFPSEFNPDLARRRMIDQGCDLEDDGVFSCDGARMSFSYATTIGDQWRLALFESFRDAMALVGIEVIGEFLAPTALFAEDFLFGGPDKWQIISFPWAFSADPHLGDSRFICQGEAPNGHGALNVIRFCDPEVENLVIEAQTEIDPASRVALYHEADRAYLRHVPMIPIFQRPVIMAWVSSLQGPTGTTIAGISSWSGPAEVTVGVNRIPKEIDPLRPDDDDGLILTLVTAGAFTTNESLEYVPVLIESAETISGGR